ncbi:VOC family protein [uncultured Coprobacter sp.]|jgi:lactoylglutathione lyase|uniref:VOC family protein n=1 Tax=uncultured Coprobacter sp. TaxID=1720550 RepID=UPI0025F2C9E5|nr:VOC family protein [uncultured Coprobacter sp.]
MKIKGRFDHFNINVIDLERSIAFYNKALGLREIRRKEAEDGSFILVYLGDGFSSFLLELTWLRDRTETYELGDNESHLCIRVEGDYDEARRFHKEMGCICYENTDMGLYFIHDPDDYWIEILPV